MIKMDMVWVAAANLIYPNVSATKTVTHDEIVEEVWRLFDTEITPVMIDRHLVSWEDRQADKANPRRGGSRNRYLFRTTDGHAPSREDGFRLYKAKDTKYDGKDKNGRTHPERRDIVNAFHTLITWYEQQYIEST